MDPVIDLVLRICFALLLASAALHKLRDPAAFGRVLADYEVVPPAILGAVAPAVIAVESALAAAILFLPFVHLGVAALLAIYAGAMTVNLVRGRADLDCGCAGPGASTTISGWLVARNICLVVAALTLSTPVAPRPLGWIDAMTIAAATATMTVCWLAAERLLALLPRMAAVRAPLIGNRATAGVVGSV